MQPVHQPTIIITSLVAYLATLALTYQFGDYRLSVSGLLVVVLLSAFTRGWVSTLLVGIASMITMVVLMLLLNQSDQPITQAIVSQFYALFILLLTMGLVLYLKSVQQDFEYEKTHVSSLFENATEGILLTNRARKIILANPAADRIFQYAVNELIGCSVDVLIPMRYEKNHHHLRDQFHDQPANRQIGSGRSLYARRKDGSEFPVEVSLSHYKRDDEPFVIAFIVDISKRKKAEQELLEQQEELKAVSERLRRLNVELEFKVMERTRVLQEAMKQLERSQQEMQILLDRERELGEIKSRFVSLASHEFRTPLSTILSSANLASKYADDAQRENRERHLHKICDQVVHMNNLLGDFLSIGKLEQGKIDVKVTAFDLHEFINELVEEMNLQLRNHQRIEVCLQGDLHFATDKRLLKNALLNVLSNAIKFSPHAPLITLEIKDTLVGKSIGVIDQGMGVPAADQPHLFSSFFRASNVTDIQGTGLGLSLVRRYVHLIGGTVEFLSELGKGTTVTLDLPRLEVS